MKDIREETFHARAIAQASIHRCAQENPSTEICGDGIIEKPNNEGFDEECDGENLGGLNCLRKGFTYGTLKCKSDCTYDSSGCVKISLLTPTEARQKAKEEYGLYQISSTDFVTVDNNPIYEIRGRVRFMGFLPMKIKVDIPATKK